MTRLTPPLAALSVLIAAGTALAQPGPTLTRAPELLQFVEATYPADQVDVAGEVNVLLDITINATGGVDAVSVVESGGAAFDEAALAAARQFRFSPAEIDGLPAAIRIQYRYRFTPPAPPPRVITTATLAGAVRDRATGEPLPGVTLSITEGPNVTTDERGRFVLEGIAPGEVLLSLAGDTIDAVQVREELVAGERLEVTYEIALRAPPAEEGEETDDLEIVVVAPALRREVVSTRIDAEQARSVPGTGGDVVRVVESLPGVGRSGAGTGQLIVWGASPEDTRVYIDGVPLPRLYHEGGIRSTVHPAFVQGLTLIPGGAGAAYGRGLGGVVLVESRGPTQDGLHGSVGFDIFDVSATLTYRAENGSYAGAAARYGILDRIAQAVDEDVDEFIPIPRFWDGQARAGLVLGNGGTLDIVGLMGGDRFTRIRENADPALRTTESRSLDYHRFYLRYRHEASNGDTVEVVPFVGYDRTSRTSSFGPISAEAALDSVRIGLRASYSTRAATWLTLRTGVDAEVVLGQHERRGSVGLPAREGDIRAFGQPPPDSLSADRYDTSEIGLAPFVEASATFFGDRLEIIPGLRLDTYAYGVSKRLPAEGNTPASGAFTQDLTVEPRLAVAVTLMDGLAIRGSIGRYGRIAAGEDRSAQFGNPALPRARATQALMSVAIQPIEALELELTGFVSLSSALAMRSTQEPAQIAGALTATGDGRVFGGQAMLRAQLPHGVFGWVSYTLSRAERRAAPGEDWRLFDYDQTHVATAVLGWTASFGLELSGRFRYASGFPRTQVLGSYFDASRDRYQPLFGRHNGIRLDSFYQLDLRVGYQADVHGTELSVYLEVQNVTNRKNVEEYVYSPDFSTRQTIRGLPILPVVGLQWNF